MGLLCHILRNRKTAFVLRVVETQDFLRIGSGFSRVGSGQGFIRIGSFLTGRLGSGFFTDRVRASSRVGSGQDVSGVGSDRVGSGRVGSGRVGSGRVGSRYIYKSASPMEWYVNLLLTSVKIVGSRRY